MPKKYEISTEAQVLLKLLRLALSTEPLKADGSPVEPFPDNVDWAEMIRLSYKQKVSALAVDGLKASKYDLYEGLNDKQAEELRPIITSWINDVKNIEQSYDYYVSVLTTLCQIFVANGLKPVILKGYGLGLNYPIPSHRGAGDIDIFVLDENGKLATEKALDIIENQLKIKAKKVPHDYEFTFKDMKVELHYDATNAYWDTEAEHYIVGKLTELLLKDCILCPDIGEVYLPSATFNATYLIRHMFGHFFTSSGNLRQYTDLMTFLLSSYEGIKWDIVNDCLMKANMKSYADAVIGFLCSCLKMDCNFLDIKPDARLTERVILDFFNPEFRGDTKIEHITYYWRNRWKHSFLTGENWYEAFMKSIVLRQFKK